MKKVEIYLTKSSRVAGLIAAGCRSECNPAPPEMSISYGVVRPGLEFIPEMYSEQDYYYCKVQYESDKPEYRIIFA